MSKIISIGTAVPAYGTEQDTILDFMNSSYDDPVSSRKLRALFNSSGISKRYSVVSDFGNNQSDDCFFPINEPLPTVKDRLTLFKEHTLPLAIQAIQDAFSKLKTTPASFGITHLITVTCTGLYSPGLDSELIEHLGLPHDIFHTSINFLGCNAAFPALKIADVMTKNEVNAKVLIVCVELCTLHYQPKNNHDNLLSNTIFGDGAAAVVMTSNAYVEQHPLKGLTTKGFYSLLLGKGKDLMGWNVTPVNFEMILDSSIPQFIGDEMHDVMLKAEKKLNFKSSGVRKWAVHPGGKKILDTIKQQLDLSDDDLQYSYKVLNEYGNMSSPTILFVLNEIMQAKHLDNETIFSLGFGPGLNIETALFTYE